jgi:chloride channel protein, CIC family
MKFSLPSKIQSVLEKISSLIRLKLELKTIILLASLIVGILSSIAAVILKNLVHFFQEEPRIFFENNNLEWLLPFTPLIGILLTILIVKILFDGTLIKGLTNLIYLIMRRASDVPKETMGSHLLTSGITVGMGGSAGLEAPIVLTGAAIGSNLAKVFRFNYQIRTLLLACGSAAGISAIFNSPIAGVIFAFEVLLPEFSIPSFIPLLISSASAAVISKFLLVTPILLVASDGWALSAVPFYIILGFLCGFISLYIIKMSHLIESGLLKIKRPYQRGLAGGAMLCVLVFLIPQLYGEGYRDIMLLVSGNHSSLIRGNFLWEPINLQLTLVIWAGLIILTKIVATSLTLGSGGNGGIIAPSLFTGAITGFFLAQLMYFSTGMELNYNNFIVVGMAGVLSGVLHSPLTAIFLIAEITGGYILIVPLMIVSALAYFISRYFNPESIYTGPLAKRGIKFRSESEKYFLTQVRLRDLVERDFETVSPSMKLGEVVQKVVSTKRNLFPVIDEERKLIGIITLNDIREIMLDTDVHEVILAYEIMNTSFHSVDIDIELSEILKIFEQKQVWNIAVTKKGAYEGFISKSNFFNSYISIWSQQQKSEGI